MTIRFHHPDRARTYAAILVSLACFATHPAFAQSTSGTLPSAHAVAMDLNACDGGEATLKDALARLIGKTVHERIKYSEMDGWVQQAWLSNSMDIRLTILADAAVDRVYERTPTTKLAQSLASSAVQTELIEAVIQTMLSESEFRNGVAAMVSEVTRRMGDRVAEIASGEQGAIGRCIEMALGTSYGDHLAKLLKAELADVPKRSVTTTINGPRGVGMVAGDAWTSGLALVMVRLRERIARSVLQTITGSLVTRAAAKAISGVGVFLLAKDLWDFRRGALPSIGAKLKEPAVMAEIRSQIGGNISSATLSHRDTFSRSAAEAIYGRWVAVRDAYRHLVELSSRHEAFRAFLAEYEGVPPEKIERAIAFVVRHEGEAGVLARLADRSLSLGVMRLEPEAIAIGDGLSSVSQALAWQKLAEGVLPQLLRGRLYQALKVEDTSREEIVKLNALSDDDLARRIASHDKATRTFLLGLDRGATEAIVAGLAEATIAHSGGFVARLSPAGVDALREILADNPAALRRILFERSRGAILSSTDQVLALRILADGRWFAGLRWLPETLVAVANKDISFAVMIARQPFLLFGLVAFAAGYVVRLLWRTPWRRMSRRLWRWTVMSQAFLKAAWASIASAPAKHAYPRRHHLKTRP